MRAVTLRRWLARIVAPIPIALVLCAFLRDVQFAPAFYLMFLAGTALLGVPVSYLAKLSHCKSVVGTACLAGGLVFLLAVGHEFAGFGTSAGKYYFSTLSEDLPLIAAMLEVLKYASLWAVLGALCGATWFGAAFSPLTNRSSARPVMKCQL